MGDRKSPRNSGFNDLEPSPCDITEDGHLGPVVLLHKAPRDLGSFLPCPPCLLSHHRDNLVTAPICDWIGTKAGIMTKSCVWDLALGPAHGG